MKWLLPIIPPVAVAAPVLDMIHGVDIGGSVSGEIETGTEIETETETPPIVLEPSGNAARVTKLHAMFHGIVDNQDTRPRALQIGGRVVMVQPQTKVSL